MNETTIAAFLAVVPEDRRERTAQMLQVVANGLWMKRIFNVDLKGAKNTLSHSTEQAFRKLLDPFWVGKGGEGVGPQMVNEIGHIYSPREAVAASKRFAKFAHLDLPVATAYRTFFAAVLPVAEALEAVKAFVVLGRKPNLAAEARKAAKLVNAMSRETCGCCLGKQAVLPNGFMHDHGYRLPRQWMKTRSCYGRDFGSLEVSVEGPKFMVKLLTKHVAGCIERLKAAENLKSFTIQRYGGKTEVIEKGYNAEFEYHLRAALANIENEKRSAEQDLAMFRKVVSEWKPTR